MRIIPLGALALIATLGLSACDSDTGPARIEQTGSGAILTAPNGHTLYTYIQDGTTDDGSACTGHCAKLFPPFLVTPESIQFAQHRGLLDRGFKIETLKENGEKYPLPHNSSWGTVRRPDGSLQWTQGAFPLYYYSGDLLPGDRGGAELYGVWQIARPASYGLE